MIEFLKESTFAVNDVLRIAWRILKREYFKILGLCVMIFLVFNLSGFLAFFLSDYNFGISFVMLLIFITTYCGFQLTLFKFVLRVIDEEGMDVYVKDSVPSTRQIVRFLVATFYFMLCILVVYGMIIVVIFPLAYVRVPMPILTQVAVSLGVLGIIFTWIRISFFPFFIIDKDYSPFQSIRFSMAITRGNFTKLLILLIFLAIFQVLHLIINFQGNFVVGLMINLVNSLLIIPLSSVVITVAYRRMTNEYEGDQDPGIIKNII